VDTLGVCDNIYKILLTFGFDMPHVVGLCATMEDFVATHKIQLLSCAIPEHFWETLFTKLKLEVSSLGTFGDVCGSES
jgi:hypothetical protein